MPVSKYGDLVGDWKGRNKGSLGSPGNDFAVSGFPFPCPVCGHDESTHCEPYHPIPGELHARCSADTPTGRCHGGLCIVKLS